MNKMRWDCDRQGCFNQKCRMHFEHFLGCFPGKLAPTDIDGAIEIGGHFLFIESKNQRSALRTGQRIFFEQLTRLSSAITAIVVCGDAETGECTEICIIRRGRLGHWQPCTKAELAHFLWRWTNAHLEQRRAA